MKGDELTEWRRVHGYTQARLAEVLLVDVGTVNRWENGKMQIHPYLPLALRGLETIRRRRRSIIDVVLGHGPLEGMEKRKRTRKEV